MAFLDDMENISRSPGLFGSVLSDCGVVQGVISQLEEAMRGVSEGEMGYERLAQFVAQASMMASTHRACLTSYHCFVLFTSRIPRYRLSMLLHLASLVWFIQNTSHPLSLTIAVEGLA